MSDEFYRILWKAKKIKICEVPKDFKVWSKSVHIKICHVKAVIWKAEVLQQKEYLIY